MDEGELEFVVTEFVARKFDILVCTTIIESGVGYPKRCNTIIIEGTDKFGLSQLYQLRGKLVGLKGRHMPVAYA